MVYEPQEDSFLIKKEVEAHARGKVLELGTGSGILAEAAGKSRKVSSVLAVDIKKDSIAYCRKNIKNRKITFKVSDLFSNVKGTFDTIIFNPPYLPEDKNEEKDVATELSGGKHGYELIARFLAEVSDHLAVDGQILLLFSSFTKKDKVDGFIKENLLESVLLSRTTIFFEDLFVYKITKSKERKILEKKGIKSIQPLARGHRGLIYTGVWKKKKVTIKMQRKDIGVKGTVNNEVIQLKVLNKRNIGPKLLWSGSDYFVYQFVEGIFIEAFLDAASTRRSDALKVIRAVFEQMYIMDNLGLNKEEMHHPIKHIIIDRKGHPVLLDFERCKKRPKVHNVTQFAQYLSSGRLKIHLARHKITVEPKKILELSINYSRDHSKKNFDALLGIFR